MRIIINIKNVLCHRLNGSFFSLLAIHKIMLGLKTKGVLDVMKCNKINCVTSLLTTLQGLPASIRVKSSLRLPVGALPNPHCPHFSNSSPASHSTLFLKQGTFAPALGPEPLLFPLRVCFVCNCSHIFLSFFKCPSQ